MSDYSGIQKISFYDMNDGQHREYDNHNTPTRILNNTRKENRNTTNKNAKNRHKTCQKCNKS